MVDLNDVKILIIDNIAYMRISIKKILNKAGYNYIREASTRVSALNVCKEFIPHIVIFDNNLLDIRGNDLITGLTDINNRTKFLICRTNFYLDEKKHKNIVYDYFQKPIDEKVFIEKIEDLYNRRTYEKTVNHAELVKQVNDFSEQIAIKLKAKKSLQILNLYGIFNENVFQNLQETMISLQKYNYINVILNFNGITHYTCAPDKVNMLKEIIENRNGKFFIIFTHKKLSKDLLNIYEQDTFIKTEIQGIRKIQ